MGISVYPWLFCLTINWYKLRLKIHSGQKQIFLIVGDFFRPNDQQD